MFSIKFIIKFISKIKVFYEFLFWNVVVVIVIVVRGENEGFK